jgi:uncharacterized protein YlxW (UPF0749 family)
MGIAETLNQFNSTITATVAALVVGVLMKFVSHTTDKRKDNLTEHLELRKELRDELDTVKEELYQLQKELNEWREKYYHQVELTTILQIELSQLRIEISEYKNSTGEFAVEKED